MKTSSLSPLFPVSVGVLLLLGLVPRVPPDGDGADPLEASAGRGFAAAAVGIGGPRVGVPPEETAESLFRRALFDEEGRRQLDEAIVGYEGVIRRVDEQRQLAATAVFRLGECYRKLGRTNEAVAQFRRVLRDFGAEEVLARLSRQNLTSLGVAELPAVAVAPVPAPESGATGKASVAAGSPESRRRQRDLVKAELALLEAERDETQSRVKAGVVSTSDLRRIEREVLQMRRELVALEVPDEGGPGVSDAEGALVPAEERGEIARLTTLIANSPDLLHTPGPKSTSTPLHDAAGLGQTEVARFLVSRGADVNSAKAPNQQTPLMLAAKGGHKAVVELLLSKGADPNRRDAAQETALFQACRQGFREVVRALVAGGAEVRIAGGRGVAIQWSTASPGTQVQQVAEGLTPLHVAAHAGAALVVKELLSAGASMDATNSAGFTALHQAVLERRAEVVEVLLEAKASPDPKDSWSSALALAIVSSGRTGAGDEALVRRLLAAGADVNRPYYDGRSPLLLAVAWEGSPGVRREGGAGVTGIVRALLEGGADPNRTVPASVSGGQTGATALHYAVLRRDVELARVLLDAGAKVNAAREADGSTPLHLAVGGLQRPMVELLLARGADPRLATKHGQTPVLLLESLADGGRGVTGVFAGQPVSGRVGALAGGLSPIDDDDDDDDLKSAREESPAAPILEALKAWKPGTP